MQIEQWRPCPDAPGYEVSSSGRVRRSVPGAGTFVGRELVRYVHRESTGYLRVLVRLPQRRRNGRRGSRNVAVARLVLTAFAGPGRRRLACHRDGRSTDCRLTNLCWGSSFLNARHRRIHAAGGVA